MELTGEVRLAAPRNRVWQGLNNPDILRRSIPGCDSLEQVSPTAFKGTGTVKIGPVKANFGGTVTIADVEPARRYTLIGEGTGIAGFAKGQAKVELDDVEDGTLLRYTVGAQIGGKIAQVGGRLVEGVSRKLAEDFFGRFVEALASLPPEPVVAPPPAPASPPVAPVPTPSDATTEPKSGVPATVWVPALIGGVALLLWVWTR